MVGGGYGTGRELVQYFTRFGELGGLLGMLLVMVGLALLLAASYDFARCFSAYDYRTFFRTLLGRGWPVFEFLYMAMFMLILAVIGAAAGTIVHEQFHIPGLVGAGLMLVGITALSFFGRDLISAVLTFWSVVLYAVFIAYFIMVISSDHVRILHQLHHAQVRPGWVVAALQYILYNSTVVPAILFSSRAIETRRQAVIAAFIAGAIAIMPAVLFHLSFAAAMPEVLKQALPVYWMIGRLNSPLLMTCFLVVLLGTFIETGIGVVQGLIERLDGWALETRGRPLSRWVHAGVAVTSIFASTVLSSVGLIALIGRGYGTIAWGFLVAFILPLFTLGIYRLKAVSGARMPV